MLSLKVGDVLARALVKNTPGTDWPLWAVYKVSIDTDNGDVHKFFETKSEASEYAELMWLDDNVSSVWAQEWDLGPQAITLDELAKP